MTSERNPKRQKLQREIDAIPVAHHKRRWLPRFDITSTWVAVAIALVAVVYHLLIGE